MAIIREGGGTPPKARFVPPPRKPPSVLRYIPISVQEQMKPEAIKRLQMVPSVVDSNLDAGGKYRPTFTQIPGPGTIKLRSPNNPYVPIHESLHALDFSKNRKPGETISKKLSEYDKNRIFRQYWSFNWAKPTFPLVKETGSYYPSGPTSDRKTEYYRQSFEGQPPTEQYAEFGEYGPQRVPHYLRRDYSDVFNFPPIPRVLYTGD